MVTRLLPSKPLPQLHAMALEQFDRLVRAVESEQWPLPTPCRGWTVRDLVNHVTVQQRWLALLLAGCSAAGVGRRLDGDQLGDDPALAFKRAAAEAEEALRARGSLDRTVLLWSGPAPATHLVSQFVMDLVVHGWDLARGIGAEARPPDLLVAFALRELSGYADRLADSGLFDPPLPVPSDADSLTRLLALTGRQNKGPAD